MTIRTCKWNDVCKILYGAWKCDGLQILNDLCRFLCFYHSGNNLLQLELQYLIILQSSFKQCLPKSQRFGFWFWWKEKSYAFMMACACLWACVYVCECRCVCVFVTLRLLTWYLKKGNSVINSSYLICGCPILRERILWWRSKLIRSCPMSNW